MEYFSVTLGDIIKWKRKEKSISNISLAKDISVSNSYIYKLEKNEIIPSLKIFSKLCGILDFSDSEIVWVVRIYKELCEA